MYITMIGLLNEDSHLSLLVYIYIFWIKKKNSEREIFESEIRRIKIEIKGKEARA